MDILGLGMADGADLRVHPTGKAVLSVSCQTQGQGHETTFAQIVAAASWACPPDDVEVVHGDTDRTPFGLGTYGSRSTPGLRRGRRGRGAQGPGAGQDRRRGDARGVRRTTWSGRTAGGRCAATRSRAETIAEIAMAAHGALELPEGVEGHLDAETVYNPPNLTYPFGAYICVVDVDPGTGAGEGAPVHRGGRLRGADQPDDRRGPGPRRAGRRGRHGADAGHRVRRRTATAWAARSWTTCCRPRWSARPGSSARPSRPSPHHPIGAKGVGESATVGSPRRGRQLGARRAPAVRGAARRHAAHPGERVDARSRAARCAPTWRSRDRQLAPAWPATRQPVPAAGTAPAHDGRMRYFCDHGCDRG